MIIKNAFERRSSMVLLVVILLGLFLRLDMVNNTNVPTPIRNDAKEYYSYAVNMKYSGIYSLQWPAQQDALEPDRVRPPGYALFLYPFVSFPPTSEMVYRIKVLQACLSALVILFVFFIFRAITGEGGALIAGFLVAISPHLIAANVYLLTESLYTLLACAFVFLLMKLMEKKTWYLAIIAGVVFGFTLLVRPTMLYLFLFLIPFLVLFLKERKTLVLYLLLGFFIVYGPWAYRNLDIPLADKTSLAVATIHGGIYPALMYNNDPKTLGAPHRFDPNYDKQSSLPELLQEIKRRFTEDTSRHVQWYLVGKSATFLSWDYIAGMGDVFVYPVKDSPYHHDGVMRSLHDFMKLIHWPLVCLSMFACLMIWMPSSRQMFSPSQIWQARFFSLVCCYFIMVHMAGTPLPRYATPIRPLLFGMSMLGGLILLQTLKQLINRR